MKKLFIVIRREYLLRIRRVSFWVPTLLVPLLLAILYALPVIASSHRGEADKVLVVDQTGLFEGRLVSNSTVHFKSMPSLDEAERQYNDEHADAILLIPLRQTTIPHDAFLYYQKNTPSLATQGVVGNQLQTLLRNAILEDVYHLEPSVYHSVESTQITLHTQDSTTGRESFAQVKTVVAIVLGVLMLLALLVFGVQVMRAVKEERANRTVEVLATCVRPLTLLVGKVAAVAFAAITQRLLWTLLTALLIRGIQSFYPQLFADATAQQTVQTIASKGSEATLQYNTTVHLVDETVRGITAIRLPLVAGIFLLYFLLGYLFYGALLAALAAHLDSDAETLQWTLLILSPLLMVLILIPVLLNSPTGGFATFITLFPFTAPVAAVVRIPFGLGVSQLLISVVLLMAAFLAAAFLASRSYKKHLLD